MWQKGGAQNDYLCLIISRFGNAILAALFQRSFPGIHCIVPFNFAKFFAKKVPWFVVRGGKIASIPKLEQFSKSTQWSLFLLLQRVAILTLLNLKVFKRCSILHPKGNIKLKGVKSAFFSLLQHFCWQYQNKNLLNLDCFFIINPPIRSVHQSVISVYIRLKSYFQDFRKSHRTKNQIFQHFWSIKYEFNRSIA